MFLVVADSVCATADVSTEAAIALGKKISPPIRDPIQQSSLDLTSFPPLKGIQHVLAEHGLKQEEVIQYARVFPFVNKLREEDVLEMSEFRLLVNTHHEKPAYEASQLLVTIVGEKPQRVQQRFVDLLLASQPELWRICATAGKS